jgi:putative spermidine/putrescine transport system substrate-binding protein
MLSCTPPEPKQQASPQTWEEIENVARGESVTLMMWQGDPLINQYMKKYVVPALKEEYDITLNLVNGQGNVIVNTLLAEMEGGKEVSEIDMVWINGETFYQLRQINALHGPFVDQLPNAHLINWESPFIANDFQQPVEGYECPWGNVQMTLIYHADKIQNPPMNLAELESWVKSNPGKFTIPTEFTGMTLLKSWLIHLAGGPGSLSGEFNEELYQRTSKQLWEYINRLKPYFWNNGESFPTTLAQLHQLFANGEVWFTMSNNDAEVDNKILQGTFPDNSRAYVPETGTIQNSHYMGIVASSARKEAAKVICNFLISPEAQYEKMQPEVWGDHTILSLPALTEEWQNKFESIPGRIYAPERSEIQPLALREPAPEYMIRLFADFRKEVIEK